MSPRTVLLVSAVTFILIGALAGYLYASGLAPARTITVVRTSPTDASQQVADAFASHILYLSE
ncbi:MAG: hypothetical protein JRM86_04385, partial [Nitrososphaerota archaeon]|nr:hypothetical protein [Nitrososphaerota archaeon]